MTVLTNLLVRLPMLLLGLGVSVAVLANSLSRFIEDEFPASALLVNPLNSEAAVRVAAKALFSADTSLAPDTLQMLQSANRLAPADARFFSLLGISEEKIGNSEAARQYYDHALRLLPTEYQALVRTFVIELKNGRSEAAAEKIELIARRWSRNWSSFEPYVAALAGDENGLNELQKKFANFPSGRQRIIVSLINENRNLPAAYELIAKWHANDVTPLNWEVNRLSTVLNKQRQWDLAHRLFMKTRSPTEKSESGYVYNGSFNLPRTGNPFDWYIRKQSGAEIAHVLETDAKDQPKKTNNYVKLRFLSNPLQLRNVSQIIHTPPGNYKFEVFYATNDLKTPKPIQITLDCIGQKNRLTTFELDQGTNGPLTKQLSFAVPDENCNYAKVEMSNEFVALTWQNRFDGEVRLYDVRVTRVAE